MDCRIVGTLIVALFVAQQHSADAGVISLLRPGSGGSEIFTSGFQPGTGFFSPPDNTDSFSTGITDEFGGFSYDPTTGLASWIEESLSGGSQIATQMFTPGVGFSGGIETTDFSAAAPDTFGGFSFRGGFASWIAASTTGGGLGGGGLGGGGLGGPGGGSSVFTQQFSVVGGLSGPLLEDLIPSFISIPVPPVAFGGFSYDPLTGSASLVVPDGPGAKVVTADFAPGVGFDSSEIFEDALSPNPSAVFAGVSLLSAPQPQNGVVPEPSTMSAFGVLFAVAMRFPRRRRQTKR